MIAVSIATYPPRRASLIEAIQRLAPQVDKISVVLNEYERPLPELESMSHVEQIVPPEDLKDTGKFLPDHSGASHVFLCDDDIVYPPDYVAKSVLRTKDYAWPGTVLGYHGSTYYKTPLPLERIKLSKKYARKFMEAYAERRKGYAPEKRIPYTFHREQLQDHQVEQLGSGVMLLHPTDLPTFDYMKSAQKFVDVRFARWCSEQHIEMRTLRRDAGWLLPIRYDETIYDDFTRANPPHVTAEIMTYAGRLKYRAPENVQLLKT